MTFGREIDPATSHTLLQHAVAGGITRFDTAAAYGGGSSETILGDWLAAPDRPAGLRIETKVLPPCSSERITASLDTSLSRLRLPAVETLYLHRWDETALDPATLRTLDAAVRSGRVRTLGLSNCTAVELSRILARQQDLGLHRIGAVQNIHNVAVRGVDAALLEICDRHRIAIITYSPLGAGFLTGKHETGVQAGSRFDLIPGHQTVYFNASARRNLQVLRAVATESGVPMTTLALAWAQRQPHIDTVLIGGRTVAHLDQAFAARAMTDTDLLREIDRRCAAT